jgi:hypothetical protein
LVSTTATGGKTTYRGIPYRDMKVLSGEWFGKQRSTGPMFLEFFDVTPTEYPWLYSVIGDGPFYTTEGWIMTSSRTRIAFAFVNSEGIMRSTVGALYYGQGKALTSGVSGGYDVIFNAFRSTQ